MPLASMCPPYERSAWRSWSIFWYTEPRRVLKTASITYYGQYYRVPEEYIGRRVWTRLKGEVLFIESGKRVIAQYQLKHDRLDRPLEADNLDLE